MDKWEYQNQPCYLENCVVREPCTYLYSSKRVFILDLSSEDNLMHSGEKTSVTIWQKIKLIANGDWTVSDGENTSFLIFNVQGTLKKEWLKIFIPLDEFEKVRLFHFIDLINELFLQNKNTILEIGTL